MSHRRFRQSRLTKPGPAEHLEQAVGLGLDPPLASTAVLSSSVTLLRNLLRGEVGFAMIVSGVAFLSCGRGGGV
ncbi:hypothetical protein ABZT03_44525, partial [Streptomyces sp. NPDC005574]|uniref:hypothetical protein n=1 Tax=Streptomyces sp. NPDC005574 TaxID=3156891 RepID=UPI0033B4B4C9